MKRNDLEELEDFELEDFEEKSEKKVNVLIKISIILMCIGLIVVCLCAYKIYQAYQIEVNKSNTFIVKEKEVKNEIYVLECEGTEVTYDISDCEVTVNVTTSTKGFYQVDIYEENVIVYTVKFITSKNEPVTKTYTFNRDKYLQYTVKVSTI